MGGGRAATRGRDGGARGRPTSGGGGPGAPAGGRGRGACSPCCLLLDLLPPVVRENPVVVEGGNEVMPRRAGVPLGGVCHIYVAPGEVGHQRAAPALVRGILVEEGR